MTVAQNIRDIATEAVPALEQWLDSGEILAGFRDAAKEKGINWSQLKALLIAQIRDNRDGGDRLTKLTEKFDLALTYADMLLNKNVAEHKNITPQSPAKEQTKETASDLQVSGTPAPSTQFSNSAPSTAPPAQEASGEAAPDERTPGGAASPNPAPNTSIITPTAPISTNTEPPSVSSDDLNNIPAFLDRRGEIHALH